MSASASQSQGNTSCDGAGTDPEDWRREDSIATLLEEDRSVMKAEEVDEKLDYDVDDVKDALDNVEYSSKARYLHGPSSVIFYQVSDWQTEI